jgi:hypothetical protein
MQKPSGLPYSLLLKQRSGSCGGSVATTKPGARPPGICLLSRGYVPGDRAQGGRAQLCEVLAGSEYGDLVGSQDLQLRAELPALAPGARCRLGRSVESGAPQAMQWMAITPGTSEIRRECWSRGRIVSALLTGAQGGCRPSMEPPNPVATTMGWPAESGKASRAFDTALHRRQRLFMKGACAQASLQCRQDVGWLQCGSGAASELRGRLITWEGKRASPHQDR